MARPRFVSLLLALITVVVYLPVCRHGFLVFDDDLYVTENRMVQNGLSVEGVRWAFTTQHASNWHPVTWLSHMLDCQWFGLDPAAHHFVNVLFHAANAVLLFLLLFQLTGKTWPAAFVAALFAWHPLRIESVAWIAERKDVLSAFFGLLTLLAYVRYAGRGARGEGREAGHAAHPTLFFSVALACFALGLMAKPMLVTLPFVMLLLDKWPLDRLKGWRPVVEKLPFFALAAASCAITFLAQRDEAVATLERQSLELRLANAAVAYMVYLWKMIWPVKLAILYPLPDSIPALHVALAAAGLIAITVIGWLARRRSPALLVGWLWFVGMLVPVIGLVQVGGQALADRYTYLPMIGVLIALVYGLAGLAGGRVKPAVWPVLAAVVLAASVGATEWQLRFWRDSEALFTRALALTTNNAAAHVNLGVALEQSGRKEQALAEYRAALQLGVRHAQAHNNLANLLSDLGRHEEALAEYREALRLKPNSPLIHANLGTLLAQLGQFDEALRELTEAARLAPSDPRPPYLLGKALLRNGRSADAVARFRDALRLDPNDVQTMTWLARVLAADENPSVRNGGEALSLAQQANDLTGGEQPFVLDTVAMAHAEVGQFRSATETVRRAIELCRAAGVTETVEAMEQRMQVYQSGQPWREKW